jgi:hypothetical protein
MMGYAVAFAVLALFATGAAAFDANSDIALDLSAGACTAFEVRRLPIITPYAQSRAVRVSQTLQSEQRPVHVHKTARSWRSSASSCRVKCFDASFIAIVWHRCLPWGSWRTLGLLASEGVSFHRWTTCRTSSATM